MTSNLFQLPTDADIDRVNRIQQDFGLKDIWFEATRGKHYIGGVK